MKNPIGVFDSGFGGLTVLRSLVDKLPEYDFMYLGDNARAPYGTRSYETVYEYTLQCVKALFDKGCNLVILACNTASAKALRTIQQKDLPLIDPSKRVLGVIRPTTEVIGKYTKSGRVGVLATSGTLKSNSYTIEIEKFFPEIKVYQQACPMWVPIVENNEMNTEGAEYFISKNLNSLLAYDEQIDAIILGCTHYPLLLKQINKYLKKDVKVLSQGNIVADSLADYLKRHPEIASRCSKNSTREFFTTDSPENFDSHAGLFYGEKVDSQLIHLA